MKTCRNCEIFIVNDNDEQNSCDNIDNTGYNLDVVWLSIDNVNSHH